MRTRLRITTIVALLVAATACREQQAAEPAAASAPVAEPAAPGRDLAFTDVTSAAGVDFVHDAGVDGSHFMTEIMGSGVALLDADGDGDLDILLACQGPHAPAPPRACSRLYLQAPDGTFADATAASGLAGIPQATGIAAGDVDNDGDVDVVFTSFGADALFRNDGAGHFSDVTREAGLHDAAWSTSASFLDFDRDGWLDLVIANYVAYRGGRCSGSSGEVEYCGPEDLSGTPATLYRNEGGGRFRDVSEASGIASRKGKGLGIACADLTGDGWVDIYVANDREPNHLWVSRGDGTFTEEGVMRGVDVNEMGLAEASMGVALGDADGDADLDVFVTNLTREKNTLYRSGANGRYQDATHALGLAAASLPMTGWGTAFVDVDLDRDEDLVVVNGLVQRGEESPGDDVTPAGFLAVYGQAPQLYENMGGAKYEDATAKSGDLGAWRGVARGLATGDIDEDGDLDLLVGSSWGPARIYRNDARHGHFLTVRAVDPALRRDVPGATIEVEVAGRRVIARADAGGSYLSSSDPRAHVGLGEATRIAKLVVRWPDGTTEAFEGAAADAEVVLAKGRGPAVQVVAPRTRRLAPSVRAAAACASASPGPRGAFPQDLVLLADTEPQVVAAIDAARKAVAARPSDSAAWARLGVLLHAHEYVAAARQAYQRASDLDPKDGRYSYLAAITLVQADPAAALPLLDRTLANQPAFVPALVRRGRILRAFGRAAEAESDQRRAVGLDPRCAAAWLELGRMALARGDLAGAADSLAKASSTAPASAEVQGEIARLEMARGNRSEAESRAVNAQRETPVDILKDPLLVQVRNENISSADIIARAARANAVGDSRAAIELLDHLIALRPELAVAYNNRALVHASMQRHAEALADFDAAARLAPRDTQVLRNRGHERLATGDAAGAAKDFEAVLAIDPADPDARAGLAAARR